MDCIGKEAIDEKGTYFRACIWEWRAIHELIGTLCSDLVGEELLSAMHWNEGAGPDETSVCQKMAERFRNWLKDFQDEVYYLKNGVVENTPEAAVMDMLTNHLDVKVVSPTSYSVERQTLLAWADFLDSCGGFEVW